MILETVESHCGPRAVVLKVKYGHLLAGLAPSKSLRHLYKEEKQTDLHEKVKSGC